MVLAALALAASAAFWLLGREGTPPDSHRTAPPDRAERTAVAEAATGDHAAGQAATAPGDRTPVPREQRPSLTVVGRVLVDARAPILGGEVLAHRGKPNDRRGFAPMAMMAQDAQGRGQQELAFVASGEVLARAAIAADGAFALDVPERHLRLTIAHDLYCLPVPEVVHIAADATATTVLLEPMLGSCLRGHAFGAEPPRLRRVHAVLEPDPMAVMRDPQGFLGTMLQVRRDAELEPGSAAFVLRAVAANAALMLLADGDGVAGRLQVPPLQPGETREVALPLLAASTLTVFVRGDDNAPIVGARVEAKAEPMQGGVAAQLQANRASTDVSGTVALRGLLPGSYRVTATANGWLDAAAVVAVPATTELTLRAGRGGAVAGIVVDAEGQPVADARVTAIESLQMPLLGDATEQLGLDMLAAIAADGTPTDAAGRFRITGIAGDQPFQLVAAHRDFAAGQARNVRSGDQDVRIVLPKSAALAGTVVAAEDGTPLREFEVEVQATMFLVIRRPVRTHTATGQQDGAFRIDGLPPGSFTLVARAPGRSDRQVSAALQPGAVFATGELRLSRGASVRGTVRDTEGRPIVRAMVKQGRGGFADNPMLAMLQGDAAMARTDEQGRYELRDLPPGRLQLVADAQGFAAARSPRLELAAGAELRDVDLVLDHGGSVAGRVLVAPGEQADEFLVMAQEQQTQKAQTVSPAPDGTFRIDNLDPGRYQVQAMHPVVLQAMHQGQQNDLRPGRGFDLRGMLQAVTEHVVSQKVVVRAGEVADVELDATELGAGVRLELEVRIGGSVLREGVVELTSIADGRLRTAFLVDGRASVGGFVPGSVRVQVRGGMTMAPIGAASDVEIPRNTDRHSAVVELPGGELQGRVVDVASGAPLSGVLVRLLPGDVAAADDLLGAVLTGAGGEFAFRGLRPGRYGIVAADVLQRHDEVAAASRLDGIEVGDGQVVDGLVLRAQPAAGVTVKVTDEGGAPVPGAMVLGIDADGRPLGGFALAVAGGDGRAVLGGLPRGRMRAVARAPGLAPDATAVFEANPRDALEVELVLRRGTRVVLDAVSRQGLPLAGADVTARCNGGPWFPALLLVESRAAQGRVELGRLAPGAWEFRISHPATGVFTVQRTIQGGAAVTVLAAPR